ncbi:MAG: hypothetical protein ACOZCL_16020 [Bacillota bacterium]
MLSFITNFYIFLGTVFLLVIEYFFFDILGLSYFIPWLITGGIYAMVIFFQVMAKATEETEKSKIKAIIDEIYYAIRGIPIVNKNDKLIIKWDIVFKKLVDKGEFRVYDKIVKMKTGTIDDYVNKYPSLLLDNNTDLVANKQNIDLNSLVKGKGRKVDEDKELVSDSEYRRNLFIKELKSDRALITNYNNSVHMDVIIRNEYEPENFEELKVDPNINYDGFSVTLLNNNKQYAVVPRFMIYGRVIDKEKWFYKNAENFLKCANNILNGVENYTIDVNAENIIEYSRDLQSVLANTRLEFEYYSLDDKYLIFKTKRYSPKNVTVYCEFDTAYNNFQVMIKHYDTLTDGKTETVELEKIIAIGHSYQPLITLLQQMPVIVKNINTIMNNGDLSDIVIK